MKKETKKKLILYIAGIVAAVVVVLVLVFGVFGHAGKDNSEETIQAIKNAVLEKALQCYVIEGAYPSKLSYLEEHYGLIVNTDDYVIDYRAAGENLTPQVTVVLKTGHKK